MINLLPPELKQAYKYAGRNTHLVRWAVMCLISFVGLAAISTAGLIYLQQTDQAYGKQIAEAQASLKAQDVDGTKAKVQDMTNSLKLAIQVLSKEILFSKLLPHLGTITPSSVVLTEFNMSDTDSVLSINAKATSYAAATQLQVNMIDPANKLFTKADIESIIKNGDDANYPYVVQIKALITPDNPFLFINNGNQP